jgi:hypothetical protein
VHVRTLLLLCLEFKMLASAVPPGRTAKMDHHAAEYEFDRLDCAGDIACFCT